MAKAAMIPRPPVPPLSLDGVGELERAYAAAPQRGAASNDGSALSRGEEQLLSPPQRLSSSVVLQVNEVLERHAHGCGISVVRCIDKSCAEGPFARERAPFSTARCKVPAGTHCSPRSRSPRLLESIRAHYVGDRGRVLGHHPMSAANTVASTDSV